MQAWCSTWSNRLHWKGNLVGPQLLLHFFSDICYNIWHWSYICSKILYSICSNIWIGVSKGLHWKGNFVGPRLWLQYFLDICYDIWFYICSNILSYICSNIFSYICFNVWVDVSNIKRVILWGLNCYFNSFLIFVLILVFFICSNI